MKYMLEYPVTTTHREILEGWNGDPKEAAKTMPGAKVVCIEERIKMVKAMEFIARHVNDEELFYNVWLTCGVADGDIRYGDLSMDETVTGSDNGKWTDEALYYTDDVPLEELIHDFLRLMRRAGRHGLYCDGVLGDSGIKRYKVSGKYFLCGSNSDKMGSTDVYDYSDEVWALTATAAEDMVVGSLVRQLRDEYGDDSINIPRPKVEEV